MRAGGWSTIAPGLLRSYRRGRKAFRRARVGPTVENLHDWRKRVKDFWYHLRWLRQVPPETMRGHAKDAHRLSELLGADHDLAVLRDSLAGMTAVPTDADSVLGLIDQRRDQLQTDAMFLGQRLYAEKPKHFLRRMHRYWKAWRAETMASSAQWPVSEQSLTSARPSPSSSSRSG